MTRRCLYELRAITESLHETKSYSKTNSSLVFMCLVDEILELLGELHDNYDKYEAISTLTRLKVARLQEFLEDYRSQHVNVLESEVLEVEALIKEVLQLQEDQRLLLLDVEEFFPRVVAFTEKLAKVIEARESGLSISEVDDEYYGYKNGIELYTMSLKDLRIMEPHAEDCLDRAEYCLTSGREMPGLVYNNAERKVNIAHVLSDVEEAVIELRR